MLDLFSGLGGASTAMKARGWEVFTVDIEPRFECTWTADLREWTYEGPEVDLVWASPPCQEFSRWGMPWLRKNNPPKPSLDLLQAALRIIRDVNPIWWIVENVCGAVPFFKPILGDPIKVGAAFLWGRYPELGTVKVAPHKEKLSSSQRAERSKIPYAISEALAIACESTIFAALEK